MMAPGKSRDSQGQALATGQPGGETAGQARDSQGQALATGQPGGETGGETGRGLARAGWAVYWKATGPEVVS